MDLIVNLENRIGIANRELERKESVLANLEDQAEQHREAIENDKGKIKELERLLTEAKTEASKPKPSEEPEDDRT